MKTVTLRIDVPEGMGIGAICDMLDDMAVNLSGARTGLEDETAEASDADWVEENGDVHYWNP